MKPKVGFHDFLNSKPILHAFQHGLVEVPFELVIDTPSALADRFRGGELDIAMIPSIEYARIPGAVIIPTVCIASVGRVETVLLFSERAMEDIESVAIDPKSRTSAAMVQILFEESHNRHIETAHGEEEPELMLRIADAGLVIGDRAFDIDREKYVVYDLGELWYQYSGRPFVHAVLCCREGKKYDTVIATIEEAKKIGLSHRDLISKQETCGVKEANNLFDYLTSRIFYDLGEQERDGLDFFLKAAEKLGLADHADLKFYT